MWPVVFRELRVQARRVTTYWLRMAGVLAAVAVFCLLCFASVIPVSEVGGRLFMSLHAVMMIFIWLAVPLMVADSIARERREGTFGLLFLTPLRPIDVLLGKLFVHFLEAMTLWVAVLPVMIIPFLLGGVTSVDVVSALALQGASIILALSAGLLASVCVREMKLATTFAVVFAAALLFLLVQCADAAVTQTWIRAASGPPTRGTAAILLPGAATSGRIWRAPGGGLMPIMTPNGVVWRPIGVAIPAGGLGLYWLGLTNWRDTWALHLPLPAWTDGLLRVGIEALGVALVVLGLCGVRVRQLSRDRGVSSRELRLYAKFCRPTVWEDLFRRRMRGSLNRNPIGWLHIRSITGRLTLWIWVGVVSVLETWTVTGGNPSAYFQSLIGMLLLAGMAYSSANSFREERQSGALELILVTPIREGTLFWGRLRGVWFQFLPAATLYVLAEILYPWHRWERQFGTWEFVVSFFALPVVGMFFSLQRCVALTAGFATAMCWLGVPLLGLLFFKAFESLMIGLFYILYGPGYVDPGVGIFVVAIGICVVITMLGLRLYVLWAGQPGRRIIGLILVLTGIAPVLSEFFELSKAKLISIDLLIAVLLVLECGRRLHQNLRTRRFLNST